MICLSRFRWLFHSTFWAFITFHILNGDVHVNVNHANAGATLTWDEIDKPVQLVKPNAQHKKLMLVDENVKLLLKIPGAVAVVAVVGKFHSGKSFLMNQLMGKSSGFGVGPTVRPQTMGIWMWGKPLLMEQPSGEKLSVVFIDTEGFAANNISETYDAKIFAVSTLLSSYLIYNSVKIIDQSDIDYLEVLSRRTQLFALRSQLSKAKWTKDFNHDLLSFPPLMWVVQDFVQSTEGLSTTEWLHRLMSSHARENEDYEISLMGIFSKIDCHTLFLPATKKKLLVDLSQANEDDLTEDYRMERDALISKLFDNLKPKEKNEKPITGPELAALLNILVHAANEGSLSDVPTRWNSFIQHLQETATEDCMRFYDADLEVLLDKYETEPIIPDYLQEWHKNTSRKSLELLEQLLYGLSDAIEKSKGELKLLISHKFENTADINAKKIQLKCADLQGKTLLTTEQKLNEIVLPTKTEELQKVISHRSSAAVTTFMADVHRFISAQALQKYVGMLKSSLNNLGDAVLHRNDKAIEVRLNAALELAKAKFDELTKNKDSYPRRPTTLNNVIKGGRHEAEKVYEEATMDFSGENMYKQFHALLQVNLNKYSENLHSENEILVKKISYKTMTTLTNSLEDRTNHKSLVLPMNAPDLEARLNTEIQIATAKYSELMEDFKIYKAYSEQMKMFHTKINTIIEQRRQENVEAFTRVVSSKLQTAKEVILLSADRYTTAFTLKQFMQKVCLLNLDEGDAKSWPLELKMQIIEHHFQTDKDLSRILQSRKGLWSQIVGFFQWILWLINLGE